MKIPLMVALLLVMALAGCATRTAITGTLPPIILQEAQEVVASGPGPDVKITFPAGEYRAAFQDKRGVYYLPVARTIMLNQPHDDVYLLMPRGGGPAEIWIEGALFTYRAVPPVSISSTK